MGKVDLHFRPTASITCMSFPRYDRGLLLTDQAIIPHIPVSSPQLSSAVYEMVFEHLLENDRPALLKTITSWPREIYDIDSVMRTIQSELQGSKNDPLLLECVGELYLVNRQPGKALSYFLRLRRPHVFDLIREHNLFTAVQDQAYLLVEFDRERSGTAGETEAKEVESDKGKHGAAVQLLVDHTHSIPVSPWISYIAVGANEVSLTRTDRSSSEPASSETAIPIHVPRLAIR